MTIQSRLDLAEWTLRTSTGAWTSHDEHTVVVQSGAPLVLTQ